jgi:hypothetical protein
LKVVRVRVKSRDLRFKRRGTSQEKRMRKQPGETVLRKQEGKICKVDYMGIGIGMGIEKTTGEVTGVEIPENRRVNPRARVIVFPSVGRAYQLVNTNKPRIHNVTGEL